jgi:DNA-binding beta-propeller fold protein YncE
MKSPNAIARTIAATLLCLAAFAAASFAATNPLNEPQGLAVASNGDLYVANSGDSNILVFGPSYSTLPALTIIQGVSRPSGVAFDTQGNLWVSNYGANSITEYINGVQSASATITDGILAPQAIAIDGLDDLWVENNNSNVTVYGPPISFAVPSTLLETLTLSSPIYGISVGGGLFSWGSGTEVYYSGASRLLRTGVYSSYLTYDSGFAMASDAKGDVYVGNLDGTVKVQTVSGSYSQFLQLNFIPSGIAIDSVRGRVYIANFGGNSIAVYSTAGKLLHTIE